MSVTLGHWSGSRAVAFVTLAALLGSVIGQTEAKVVDPASYSYLESQRKGPDYTVADVWQKHTHLPNFDAVKQSAGDVFSYLPKEFDPHFKSPCWKPEAGKDTVKCLPYFQILGVSKCGTTDLFHRLTANPDMVDSSWKGPHFWDEQVYPSTKEKSDIKYDGTFEAYVRIFDKAANTDMVANPQSITADASSNTFTGAITFCRGVMWPKKLNVTLPQLLWEATPYARFIVMMRDPVDRYYSAYYYYRAGRAGPGAPQKFHEQAKAEIKAWNTCVEQAGEIECLRRYQPQQLVKGMYAAFFPFWLEVWPRDRFMCIRNEDYKDSPIEHVAAVTEFLGMKKLDMEAQKSAATMEARNVKKYESMLYETRQLLQDFYRPFNHRLAKLMGDDPRWLWGY